MELKQLIRKMIKDFNERSELVEFNYQQMKEEKCDESTLQWNRGNLNQIESYLKYLADAEGITLKWECGKHTFGYDDWRCELEYRTVHCSFDN